jgi:hypothetical protein
MMTGRIGVGFLIVLLMLLETFPPVAGAGENRSDAGTNVLATRLIQRMDRLENRVTDLEAQVVTLKREKTEAQENL